MRKLKSFWKKHGGKVLLLVGGIGAWWLYRAWQDSAAGKALGWWEWAKGGWAKLTGGGEK